MNAALTNTRPARLFNARITLLIVCLLGIFALLASTMADARGGRGGGGGMRGGGGGMRGGGGGRSGYGSVGSANRAATRPSGGNISGDRGNAGNSAGTLPSNRPGNAGSGDRLGNGNAGSRDQINNSLPGSGDRVGNINSGNINIDVDPGYGHIRHPIAAGMLVGAMVGAAIGSGYGYGYGYWGGYYGTCGYYYDCYYSLPTECPMIYAQEVPYFNCGGTYYQQQMQGDTVVYVMVEPPADAKAAKDG